MPNADTRHGFFDPTLTFMMDSYYIAIHEKSIVSAVIHVVLNKLLYRCGIAVQWIWDFKVTMGFPFRI